MATVSALNIEIYRGDDVAIDIALPAMETGASLSVRVAPYFGAAFDLPAEHLSVSANTLTLSFDKAFTNSATWRVAEYEIHATTGDKVKTLYEGEIRIVERDTALHNNATVTVGNTKPNNPNTGIGDLQVVTLPEAQQDFNSM